MSTDNTCANCGKGEQNSGDLKACTACKLVKYCNRDCQIAHRPQHKKACKKRAAELHDNKLFKENPPREECPICFLPIPHESETATFYSCCGKSICVGCIYAMDETGGENMKLCPFCKAPPSRSPDDEVERLNKLMAKGNADAFYQLGGDYTQGISGLPQDRAKAIELWLKAGELGCANAYNNLGIAYSNGDGVEIDKKKAKHYWELAALNGSIQGRYNIGAEEYNACNHQRAFKHFILAAKAGDKALKMVKHGYTDGYVTKEEYANTLREYQKRQDEMKSDARVSAAEALQTNPPHQN